MSLLNKIKMHLVIKMDLPERYQHDKMLDTWVEKQLKKLPKDSRILDVGAGEQKYKKYCMHLNYTSQDFCQYEGEGDGSGLQMGKWDVSQIDIISDITDIPVEDNTFDAVLCTEVLEHVPDPQDALKEISRILKMGGGTYSHSSVYVRNTFCALSFL